MKVTGEKQDTNFTAQMNYDLETMGEAGFFKKWGMNKNDLVFSRLKWREGYYD